MSYYYEQRKQPCLPPSICLQKCAKCPEPCATQCVEVCQAPCATQCATQCVEPCATQFKPIQKPPNFRDKPPTVPWVVPVAFFTSGSMLATPFSRLGMLKSLPTYPFITGRVGNI
uniref:Uncharacterized protein n=1 Tax=Ficedula albicollis TaxID=59894 RepID=A0A803VB39_FICAL